MLDYLVNVCLPGVGFMPEYCVTLAKKYKHPIADCYTWETMIETWYRYNMTASDAEPPVIPRPTVPSGFHFTYYNQDQWVLNEGMMLPLLDGTFHIFMSHSSNFHGPRPSDLVFEAVPWFQDLCACSNERRYTVDIDASIQIQGVAGTPYGVYAKVDYQGLFYKYLTADLAERQVLRKDLMPLAS
jgi:hypothetical protein